MIITTSTEPEDAARQAGQEFVHQVVAAQAPEDQGEHLRADDDTEDHGADLHGRLHNLGQSTDRMHPAQAGQHANGDGNAAGEGEDNADPFASGDEIAGDPQVDEGGQEQHRHQAGGGEIDRLGIVAAQTQAAKQDGADGADRGGFRRRRDAAEDRAQHGDNQNHRRHQSAQDLRQHLTAFQAGGQLVRVAPAVNCWAGSGAMES